MGDGWRQVRRKERRRSHGGRAGQDDECTTFFFTHFPDSFGPKEMWGVFQKWGNVVDVFIPNKVDRWGNRFGFVRFVDVHDAASFGDRLDKILIGHQKLHVNTPRYTRGVRGDRNAVQKATFVKSKSTMRDGRRQSGISYAKVVQGQKQVGNNGGQRDKAPACEVKARDRIGNGAHISFDVPHTVLDQMKHSYIGKVRSPGDSYKVQEKLHVEGYFSVKAIPMGANMVLMEAGGDDQMSALIDGVRDWISNWFEEIRNWSTLDVDTERFVWVNCMVILVHAWSLEFFTTIASCFGRFVRMDETTERKLRLDVGRILLRTTSPECISRVVRVDVNGELFSIKVVEEAASPHFFNVVGDNSVGYIPGDVFDSASESTDSSFRYGWPEEELSKEHFFPNSKEVDTKDSFVPDSLESQVQEGMIANPLQGVEVNQYESGGVILGEDFRVGPDTQVDGDNSGTLPNIVCKPDALNWARLVVGQVIDETQQNIVGLCAQSGEGGPCSLDLEGSDHPVSCSVRSTQGLGPFFQQPALACNEGKSRLECVASGNIEAPLFQFEGVVEGQSSAISPQISSTSPTHFQLDDASGKGETQVATELVSFVDCSFREQRPETIIVSAEHVAPVGAGMVLSAADSATDSDIHRCNQRFLLKHESSMGERVWVLSKSIGVSGSKEDAVYVQLVEQLEARDSSAKGGRGSLNVPL